MSKKQYVVIAVDDEIPSLELIEHFVSGIPGIRFERSFSSPAAALDYLRENPVDIVVLDIEMAGVNGLNFAASLDRNYKVIFSTAHRNYALEGFNLSAVDYVLKPYSKERLVQAVGKAVELLELEQLKSNRSEKLVVKVNYTNQSVLLDDILFIESLSNLIIIHLSNGTTVQFRDSLKNLDMQLAGDRFKRIHRSFIVNTEKIVAFNRLKVTVGDTSLPVSQMYRDELLAIIRPTDD